MTDPELRRAICLLADSTLLLWRIYRSYLTTWSPRDANLQRIDDLIERLEALHQECWVIDRDLDDKISESN